MSSNTIYDDYIIDLIPETSTTILKRYLDI